MKPIGKVAAILNAEYLIVDIAEVARPGSSLTVFSFVESPGLKPIGLDRLIFPKGKVTIVSHQSEGKYLASISIRESLSRPTFKFATGPIFSTAMTRRLGGIADAVQVPKKVTGALDTAESLDIGLDDKITVGDLLAWSNE